MIRTHTGRRLTQGSIFSNAKAEHYDGCRTFGLIITARCDIAHDKARSYSYLPVVAFDDWLHRDFCWMLVERAHNDVQQRLVQWLEKRGIPTSLLLSKSPRELVDLGTLPVAEPRREKERNAARKQGVEIVALMDLVRESQIASPGQRKVLGLAERFPGLKKHLISECLSHELHSYYFLPRVEPDGEESGYVVLLREVRPIPADVSDGLAIGLEGARYEELYRGPHDRFAPLALPRADIAWCVGQLDSPHIEHLMQTFSLMFGRIGLPDLTDKYIERIWDLQPSVKAAPL